jgi:hypothetical protein
MWLRRSGQGFVRQAFVGMAFLALFLKVAVPPGYMIGPQSTGFPIEICTGHGGVTIPGKGDAPADQKSKPDSPCAFAGHGLGFAPPPIGGVSAQVQVAFAPLASPTPYDLAPGRGLAAPPPQSHAPPSLLLT